MKKVLSMILVLAMMLSLVTVTSVTSTAEEVREGIELTASNLTNLVSGETYYMTGDIEFAGPIDLPANITVYGNGYKLINSTSNNFFFEKPVEGDNISFDNVEFESNYPVFDHTPDGASTCSVSFTNCSKIGNDFQVSDNSFGAYLRRVWGGTVTFTNCTNSVNMQAIHSLGGFVGDLSGTTAKLVLNNCVNEGNMTCTNGSADVGGFVGKVRKGAIVEINGCVNKGTVIYQGSFGYNVGGFIGNAADTNPNVTFQNCHNAGNVSAPTIAGGFVGNLTTTGNATFKNCKNSGTITATNDPRMGSFTGTVKSTNVSLTNCINTGVIKLNDTQYPGYWTGTGAGSLSVTTINCADTQQDTTPTVAPVLVGSQETTAVEGKQKIRLIAAVDSLLYDEAGFKVSVEVNGQPAVDENGDPKVYSHASKYAFLSLKAGENYVTPVSVKEKNLVGDMTPKYLYTLTFEDVPASADTTVVFKVKTYGVIGNDEKVSGEYTITYKNGSVYTAPAAN